MKKVIYHLANIAKLIGQLLSSVLSIAYVLILTIFSVTLILPNHFQEKQIFDFINKFTSNNMATELTALAYSPDKIYTFIIVLVIILILIGLFIFRVRIPLIIAGIPALSVGVALLNINFFYNIVSDSLNAEDLLVFEDLKEKILIQSKTTGLFFTVFGIIAASLGIYLIVRNQKKLEQESTTIATPPVIEKIDFEPVNKIEEKAIEQPQIKEIRSNIFCSNCNTEYEIDSLICTKCGQKRNL